MRTHIVEGWISLRPEDKNGTHPANLKRPLADNPPCVGAENFHRIKSVAAMPASNSATRSAGRGDCQRTALAGFPMQRMVRGVVKTPTMERSWRARLF